MRHTKYMRTILVLTCCLALTAAVRAEDQTDKNKTKTKTTSKVVRSVNTTNTHAQGVSGVQSNTTNQSNKFQSNTALKSNKFNSNTKFNSKALHTSKTPFHTQQFHLKNGPN